jgi:AAA-ATPase Vps4-associated protein 1
VLATINTVDFLYTCPGHLADSGFATSLGGSETRAEVSEEEIAKVKQEWEEKQRKKLEEGKEKAMGKEKGKEKDNEGEVSKPPKVPSSLPTSPPSTPSHERYALHRDYFAS